MINDRYIAVFDFETGGKDPLKVEITQVAAVIIHPHKLTIVDEFNSEVRPLEPDKLEDEALKITRKTREALALAPHPKNVWADFQAFIQKYNPKSGSFTAPIAAGYNIRSYDMPIVQRYCDLYGPTDKQGKQGLFNNWIMMDLMDYVWLWWYQSKELPDIKQATVASYLGLDVSNAHDALCDVKNCAKILIKFLKLHGSLRPQIKFKGAFDGVQ